ncbi:MAG TPA: hypothetical protein VFA04_09670 [Bryobacteraceae bacterium]|nr:hypothetical protein [Bryobacteraceae bacterium]
MEQCRAFALNAVQGALEKFGLQDYTSTAAAPGYGASPGGGGE